MIPIYNFRPSVPAYNGSIQILTYYCVISKFNDCRQIAMGFFQFSTLCDVFDSQEDDPFFAQHSLNLPGI